MALKSSEIEALSTALNRRFGRVEPAVGLGQRLGTRIRASGDKLGVLAANVLYLARQGYPDYQLVTQRDLAKEAFVCGLTPTALRQQDWLTDPHLVISSCDLKMLCCSSRYSE
ncbi:UNVERIFIED_CONTAM: hypothetical protein FKN15_066133 [Acipenser sinensis]